MFEPVPESKPRERLGLKREQRRICRLPGWQKTMRARQTLPPRRSAAWDELVDRYQRLIYAIPRRAGLSEEQASDVFQEVFLTLVEKIDEIQQPEKIRSWMVTTAKFKTWGLIRGSKGFHSPDTTEEMENEMASIPDESPLAGRYADRARGAAFDTHGVKGIRGTMPKDTVYDLFN
jgi:DNA-directed RNA polymerase specialized sigma24 family protein